MQLAQMYGAMNRPALDVRRWITEECWATLRTQSCSFSPFDARGRGMKEIENSAYLRFLLDSAGSHGLGVRFAACWFEQIAYEGGLPDFLSSGRAIEAVTARTEVRPPGSERRLDVLVRVQFSDGGEDVVIGVENKHFSPESEGQVGDYQKGLLDLARGADAHVLFLTPHGSEAKTAGQRESRLAKYSTVPHRTVVLALKKLVREAGDDISEEVKDFLHHYGDHLAKLFGYNYMIESEKDKEKAVHELFKDKEFREAMVAIDRYRPTPRALAEELREAWRDGHEGDFEFCPKFGDPREFQFCSKALNTDSKERKFWITYMLISDNDSPWQIGSTISAAILAWIDPSFPGGLEAAQSVTDALASGAGRGAMEVEAWRWGRWLPIWVCEGHRTLGALQEDDLAGLLRLLEMCHERETGILEALSSISKG